MKSTNDDYIQKAKGLSLATAKTAVAKTTTVKSAVKAKPDVKTAAKTTATAKK